MTTVVAPAHTATPAGLPRTDSPPLARNRSPLRYSLSRQSQSQSQPQPPPPPQPRTVSNPTMSSTPRLAPEASVASLGAIQAQTSHSSPHSHASADSTSGRSPPARGNPERKSPTSSTRTPLIRVKKEPSSPKMNSSSRPRPRRLDLSSSASGLRGPQTAGAVGSKESAGLAIKDLGVACLSPGFQTQDPSLQERLARSISVKEQQRQLIEARQKGGPSRNANEGAEDTARAQEERFGPQTARRKGPPPGLSIHTPAASSFSHERVIQSAPLHQSFTGLRQQNVHHHPPSNLGQSNQVYHAQAQQTANRLPSISDVFADRRDGPPTASFRPSGHPAAQSPSHPPMASPSFPPQQQAQYQQPLLSSRSREFRSAEEAVQDMAGGREELLPKLVHYGGTQPPTPPSPAPHHHAQHHLHPHDMHAQPHHTGAPPPAHYDPRADVHRTNSMSGRRRPRDEYERENTSPNVQPGDSKRHRDGSGDWRHTMSGREKKDEFLRLCERAWELFHS